MALAIPIWTFQYSTTLSTESTVILRSVSTRMRMSSMAFWSSCCAVEIEMPFSFMIAARA